MKFTILKSVSFASMLLLGSVSLAGATTITESVTTGALQTTDFTDNLSVAGFNASLGTLTGVTATLSANGAFSGSVTNAAAVTENFKISEDVNLQASSSAALLSSLTTDLIASQTYTLGSGAVGQFGPYSPTASASGTATAAQISDFIGGNITAAIQTLTGTNTLGGGGNIKNAIVTQADATLTIVYTYTPKVIGVPEPASMAVLGLGLVGLGFVRARASKKA